MTTIPEPKQAIRAAVAEALKAEGGTDGYHSWRCAHPDRYGPCDCDEQVANEVLVKAWPLVERYWRDHLADELLAARLHDGGCDEASCLGGDGWLSYAASIIRGQSPDAGMPRGGTGVRAGATKTPQPHPGEGQPDFDRMSEDSVSQTNDVTNPVRVQIGGYDDPADDDKLDEAVFQAVDVHFEAMGDAQFWIGIRDPKTGQRWALNCGAVNHRVKGYARLEEEGS